MDSDDDVIISQPKVKREVKVEAIGDDSDDALLSIIHKSKDIESDEDSKALLLPSASRSKSAAASSAFVDHDDDDAKLHPALQPLPDDVSKRAAKSSLPLMAAPAQKLQHVLVQCDEDCADLAGDSGVIGRFKSSEGRMLLDLKGYMYEGSLVPCCSLAVVHMKPTEARVEAVLDEFISLKQIGNVYDKEVAHGNMNSDDDDGSEGIVLSDNEELDAPNKKKDAKASKAPSSASKPKAGKSSSSKSGSKSATKAKPSKSKPKQSKTKSAGSKSKGKASTPKSGQPVRCTQPPLPLFHALAAYSLTPFFVEKKHSR